MSRRRIEMFQYRIALAQMRRGASEREIARSHWGASKIGGNIYSRMNLALS